jgi:predicted nucleic acid-binding protein
MRLVVIRRGSRLRQLTIRGFDPEVEEHLRELARRERLSLNQAVMKLLRRATGAELLSYDEDFSVVDGLVWTRLGAAR